MKKEIDIDVTSNGMWLDADITYAHVPGWLGNSTRDLKLSIIRPFPTEDKKYPVIVWFAGGGWMDVDYNIHLANLVEFAKKGFIIASVEYRDSNKINFPGQLTDAKAAIRFLRKNAEDFQIDTNKFIAMGESAGGHMASMLGVTNGVEKFDIGDNLEFSSDVQLSIPWYGVVDPLTAKQGSVTDDFDFVYRNLLGKEPEESPTLDDQANPLTYINKNTVPFLILHGEDDVVVPVKDGIALYDKLQSNQIESDLYILKNTGHMDIKFWQEDIRDIVVDFINKNI
ncbi:alpha/beta hydrolase [Lactobacillus terrae]|uniref:alpha/beta hydrolase n=1 Tax=Lactobacillus terrae TaxID=2269374 RepID=UPI000C1B6567|nr:alpha/beta hydrolase [Lactobacillus terrae]